MAQFCLKLLYEYIVYLTAYGQNGKGLQLYSLCQNHKNRHDIVPLNLRNEGKDILPSIE